MEVLGSFVLFAALLGCHASDLSQDAGLIAVINQMQAETTKLATLVKDVKKENEAMKMENEAMKMENEARKMENEAMKTEFDSLRNSTLAAVTPMCFSAVMTTIQDVVSGNSIIFDQEIIDTHDKYNPTNGIYVIPQTGIWEVIVTMFKPSGLEYNENTVELKVDDTGLSMISHYTGDGEDRDHSTSTIIRVFNAGAALRVQATVTGTFFGAPFSSASQFSAKFLGEYP